MMISMVCRGKQRADTLNLAVSQEPYTLQKRCIKKTSCTNNKMVQALDRENLYNDTERYD